MLRLTSFDTGDSVFINPDVIEAVIPLPDIPLPDTTVTKRTRVDYSRGSTLHSILVTETSEQINEAIDKLHLPPYES